MPHIPCPISITCGSPDDVDDPLSNFSSELPDVIRFGATGWAPPTIDPGLPPGDPPVVPNGYIAQGCVSICFSSVSQEEANLCAANQALLCGFGQGGCNGSVCPTSFLPLTPKRMFFNQVQQCTYTCPDGTLFITTVGAGTFAASTQAEADQVAHDYACGIAANSFICLSNLASETCLGSAYSSTVTAIGGNLPLTFTIVSGALPPGLSMSSGLDGKSFTISGITMIAGVYAFQIKVNDSTGHTAFKVFTIKVTGIDNASLPGATVGVAYSQTLTAASMAIPLTWSVKSGALPAGLSLNSVSGVIFGTPTTTETAHFVIQCADSTGVACTKAFSIVVAAGVLGWWTWNGGIVLPFNDSVAAQPFTDDLTSPAHYAFVAGKINEALELTPAAGFSYNPTQRPSTASMGQIRDGFTCTVWMRPNNWGGNDFFGVDIFAINGIFTIPPFPPRVYTLVCQYENNPGQFHLTATDAGFITLIDLTIAMALVPGTWYFITFGWDKTTGRMFFSINDGAMSFSAGSDPLADAFTTARVSLQGQNFSTVQNIDWDEINVWPGTLSAAQISNLYNGGAGRTYTDLFP